MMTDNQFVGSEVYTVFVIYPEERAELHPASGNSIKRKGGTALDMVGRSTVRGVMHRCTVSCGTKDCSNWGANRPA